MSLMNELEDIQEEMTSLLSRLGDLQKKVESLEAQNTKLLDRLNEKDIMSEGIENLQKLYDEGYHICPQLFGKKHNGEECWMCRNFLDEQLGA